MGYYNVNPMLIIQAIRNGQNPQQLLLNILQNNMANTPLGAHLFELAKNGKTAEIEQIVRNISAQRGIDYDREFPAFLNMLGIKK